MPTLTSEGIIIGRKNFGEADRILTIITPYKGKISVLAKGVRRITSRRAGNVELMNRVKIHIFQGKGMKILTEAESIDTFPKIKSNLTRSSYGSYILELIGRLLPEDQSNPEAFKLLLTVLTLLNEDPRQLWLRAFEVKLLTCLGYWNLTQIDTSPEVRKILYSLETQDWMALSQLKPDSQQALELEMVLRYYIERILESPIKSIRVIREINKDSAS